MMTQKGSPYVKMWRIYSGTLNDQVTSVPDWVWQGPQIAKFTAPKFTLFRYCWYACSNTTVKIVAHASDSRPLYIALLFTCAVLFNVYCIDRGTWRRLPRLNLPLKTSHGRWQRYGLACFPMFHSAYPVFCIVSKTGGYLFKKSNFSHVTCI